jgi:hypothetical protein
MKDYTQITQSTELRLQANSIFTRTAALKKERLDAKAQLKRILRSESSASSGEVVHELRDRIFGYRIEIEALEVLAHRLLKQARDQDTAHV